METKGYVYPYSPGGSSDDETENQKVLGKPDKHSTNTWPPKQVLSQTGQEGPPHQHPPEQVPFHRPVSMQWSDPLANRTPWPGKWSIFLIHFT